MDANHETSQRKVIKKYERVNYVFSKEEFLSLRELFGYSRLQFADYIGISYSYAEKIESPRYKEKPTVNVIRKMQYATEMTNAELVELLPRAIEMRLERLESGKRFRSEYPHYKPI